jgi:hypothetical protein
MAVTRIYFLVEELFLRFTQQSNLYQKVVFNVLIGIFYFTSLQDNQKLAVTKTCFLKVGLCFRPASLDLYCNQQATKSVDTKRYTSNGQTLETCITTCH